MFSDYGEETAVSQIQVGEQHSVTLLGGEELRPIQGGEQQSPSAVFYSATVIGEEALGEDMQQLLQPIVSYSVQ